jgi:hypothetical protein
LEIYGFLLIDSMYFYPQFTRKSLSIGVSILDRRERFTGNPIASI